ncbi:Gfo/Idh/MocA family protein [Radiobacillus deserti]|uniref:Gfo/Idh/MocA family oxidoreductase n=1 Tax=Radiobacillus deserti TaxID=2594883 RepID=A0A516KIS4_9BACI|nr:Gfo/Idh/MocA family oxidoreductase [Radiobacillus deserti]QDP41295.1 Gfo/Idh/MocA family oxidoreductase [Radiobacillus deserti]
MSIRWGILSTAKIGKTQVIPAIQRSANGSVEAIASRGEKAKQVAEELRIPKAYTSYEALLQDPDMDAIYIPLPNGMHKEWVIQAAEHGKHVLCEKPAALDSKELEEMLKACDQHNVRFMEAFMYQFHPQHEKVKELIKDGEIGKVTLMRAKFSFLLQDKTNIRLDARLGGGALYDVGCYGIHSITTILEDQPVSVSASATFTDGVDTTLTGILSFSDGKLANFDCSFDTYPRCGYEVVGSKGSIEVLNAYRPDLNPKGEGIIKVHKDTGEVEEYHVEGDQYRLQVEHFADSILEQREPVYGNERVRSHFAVLDACYESARTGKVIKL